MNIFSLLFDLLTFSCFAVGMLTAILLPLAFFFEQRRAGQPFPLKKLPFVSIIVPAYNEEKVIANCLNSILKSDYPSYEIIVVDDGSTDDTWRILQGFKGCRRVTIVNKENGGKASALNTGIAHSHGSFIFLVDADGLFYPCTIREMLRGFSSEEVGAVCGNDLPVNRDRLKTRLAAIQTHVSTGLVRRALAGLNCLPVVSGNIGAFRRSILGKTGPLLDGFIGEDLELTWRVHRAGYRVNFAPQAYVAAEAPSTLADLWRQRVRWARGLLKTAWLHRDMFFQSRYGMFGFYLPINVLSAVVVPVLQILLLAVFPLFLGSASWHELWRPGGVIAWSGLSFATAASVAGICLDKAWYDLKYLYLIPLWIPFSLFMDCVMLRALYLELRGKKAAWCKPRRTGVVSKVL